MLATLLRPLEHRTDENAAVIALVHLILELLFLFQLLLLHLLSLLSHRFCG